MDEPVTTSASGESSRPAALAPQPEPLLEFLAVMRRLQAEDPWKAEQTHRSLAPYLLEEAHEVVEAIDSGDDEHLCEELGDVLLQVYFHSVLAEQRGAFTLHDVAQGVIDKMHRRNPHVFGPEAGSVSLTAAEVEVQWQRIKAEEKAEKAARQQVRKGAERT
jgi:XTP/dITP diphosphohydrolase